MLLLVTERRFLRTASNMLRRIWFKLMKTVTYKQSGVDIEKANVFVKDIQRMTASTMNPDVIKRKGSFGALYSLNKKLKQPVMVSSTDGVGTKLLLASSLNKHDTVGIDLVAMNVNDILCVGARPLFFLDYIACGNLQPRVLREVVKGIAAGCRQSGSALIGTHSAGMPFPRSLPSPLTNIALSTP